MWLLSFSGFVKRTARSATERFPLSRVVAALFPIFIVFGISALCVSVLAQRTTQRLILKDGSYQIVTKYEIHGDRVHYFSAERSEWEDVPAAMVDWDATKKWQEDRAGRAHSGGSGSQTSGSQTNDSEMKQVDAEEQAEREKEAVMSPEVAPGVKLPETGGVFLLDIYRDKPELVELEANGGEVKPQRAKNVLRSTVNPVASARESIELPGAHAKVQAHIPDPVIFVNLDAQEEPIAPGSLAQEESRFRIVRVPVIGKGTKRMVGVVKVNVLGKVSEQENFLPFRAEPLKGNYWLRFMPSMPLDPGQYALVEMVSDRQINIDGVFDFGVNAAAPENPGVWKAATGESQQAGNASTGSGNTGSGSTGNSGKEEDPAKLKKRQKEFLSSRAEER